MSGTGQEVTLLKGRRVKRRTARGRYTVVSYSLIFCLDGSSAETNFRGHRGGTRNKSSPTIGGEHCMFGVVLNQ